MRGLLASKPPAARVRSTAPPVSPQPPPFPEKRPIRTRIEPEHAAAEQFIEEIIPRPMLDLGDLPEQCRSLLEAALRWIEPRVKHVD